MAAIVVGPLAWVMLAFGQDRSAAAFADASVSGEFHTEAFVQPLVFLAGAGLLLGLVGTLRFSPLGATLIGICYTSSYTLLLVAPRRTLDLLTTDLSVADRHADLTTPIRTGTTLVLGVLLLGAALSIGRRRRRPRPATAVETATNGVRRPAGGDRTEPDLAVRYVTRPEPAETDTYAPSWSYSPQRANDYYRW